MSTTTKIVTGVDYVGIPSNDLETARAFYENVLGLEASSVWQRPGEDAVGAEFETGTVTIALINCPGLGIPFSPTRRRSRCRSTTSPPPAPSSSHAASTFLGDTIDSGVCHMANFKDPDGNAMMLHQRYAPKG